MTGLETAGAIASLVMAGVTTTTLIVLIWYTVETHRLRLEAQRQNENSVMPIVVFQAGYFPPHERSASVLIRNLGAGPAFNVTVGPMTISGKPAAFDHSRTLAAGQDEFVAVPGLREAKRDSAGGYDDGKIHSYFDLLTALQSDPDVGRTNGEITYTSASGKKYRTAFTLDHQSHDPESFVVFDGMEAL